VYQGFDQTVIKAQRVETQEHDDLWEKEYRLSSLMWRIGVGPKMLRHILYKKRGYYIMEQIRPIPPGTIHLISESDQIGFSRLFKTMIQEGYAHMDNHPGNLGYTLAGAPILYDFGWTREFSGNPAYALSFTLGIVLVAMKEWESSYFFRLFCDVICRRHPDWSVDEVGPAEPDLIDYVSPRIIAPRSRTELFHFGTFLIINMLRLKQLNDPHVFTCSSAYILDRIRAGIFANMDDVNDFLSKSRANETPQTAAQ